MNEHPQRASELTEHFFRHEYGRILASLVRRVGAQHLEAVEDAVQTSLMTALESWTVSGLPSNPTAWLFRVAHNSLMGNLRQTSGRRRLLEANVQAELQSEGVASEPVLLAGEVQDDLLRMLFVCCDEAVPAESQLVLALKTLCGFSVPEIAQRLFLSEANTYKRLTRARARLREDLSQELEPLTPGQQRLRLPALHNVLYTLFTEGHLSSHEDEAIRRELCDEAIRLTNILVQHRAGQTPTSFALFALMHLHSARLDARQNLTGELLLLEEQNRTEWDAQRIQTGLQWLARSAEGDVYSRFHGEAAIAAEHCLAASYSETRWDRIVDVYAILEGIDASPLHRLNRAVAMAEWKGPTEGLNVLEGSQVPPFVEASYLWSAVLADLHGRCGHSDQAKVYRERALEGAPSAAVKDALQRRFASEHHV